MAVKAQRRNVPLPRQAGCGTAGLPLMAGYIPVRRGSCERAALSLIAAACRWLLLLRSPLLFAQPNESIRFVGEADRDQEQPQRRHVTAHEHAASVHDKAAAMHQRAAEFFDEHGEPGKADRERDLADREAQAAEADRREAAAEPEGLPPDP